MGPWERRLTVGSLRGVPQGSAKLEPARSFAPSLPPSKRGRACFKKLCAGCPWAEAVRRSLRADGQS